MQNTTSSSNLGAIGTGIVPPPMHSQQSQYMQSTTPSVANGKEEMRGWLYKWTNVKEFLLVSPLRKHLHIHTILRRNFFLGVFI